MKRKNMMQVMAGFMAATVVLTTTACGSKEAETHQHVHDVFDVSIVEEVPVEVDDNVQVEMVSDTEDNEPVAKNVKVTEKTP